MYFFSFAVWPVRGVSPSTALTTNLGKSKTVLSIAILYSAAQCIAAHSSAVYDSTVDSSAVYDSTVHTSPVYDSTVEGTGWFQGIICCPAEWSIILYLAGKYST